MALSFEAEGVSFPDHLELLRRLDAVDQALDEAAAQRLEILFWTLAG